MVTLDFSECKTVSDVQKIFEKNKDIIPSATKIVKILEKKKP